MKEQLKIDYNLISRKLEDSQNSFQQLESQNYELIKRNKNLVSTQDNFQKEVIKQNQTLLLNEQKLKEQFTSFTICFSFNRLSNWSLVQNTNSLHV